MRGCRRALIASFSSLLIPLHPITTVASSMLPALFVALLALHLPLALGLFLPLQTTNLSRLAKRSPPTHPHRSQVVDGRTQEVSWDSLLRGFTLRDAATSSSWAMLDAWMIRYCLSLPQRQSGPALEQRWYFPPTVKNQRSEAQGKDEREAWRNDFVAELDYRKAYDLFNLHRHIKESRPDGGKNYRFALSKKDDDELGEPGKRLYRALRDKYRSEEYNRGRPGRGNGQKTDDSVTRNAVEYTSRKLEAILGNERKGTSFDLADLKKMRAYTLKLRKKGKDMSWATTELWEPLRDARDRIMNDWKSDPYTRYMNDVKVPLPLLDKVLAEMPTS